MGRVGTGGSKSWEKEGRRWQIQLHPEGFTENFSQALSGTPGDASTSFTTLISALLCMFGYDPFLKSVIWEEREEHYLKGIPQPFLPSRNLVQCGESSPEGRA